MAAGHVLENLADGPETELPSVPGKNFYVGRFCDASFTCNANIRGATQEVCDLYVATQGVRLAAGEAAA